MVVKEPQNPTATSSEYFASKLKPNAKTENNPKIKLPKMFTIKTLTGMPQIVTADSTSLYRSNAPVTAPTASNAISMACIFCPPYFSPLRVGIISNASLGAV
jgi:hypothetical protein